MTKPSWSDVAARGGTTHFQSKGSMAVSRDWFTGIQFMNGRRRRYHTSFFANHSIVESALAATDSAVTVSHYSTRSCALSSDSRQTGANPWKPGFAGVTDTRAFGAS